jgi:hypothetical protein
MDFGRKRLSKEDINILMSSIVISNTQKYYFTASNVDTTGEANDETVPTIVVDNEGNVVLRQGDFN